MMKVVDTISGEMLGDFFPMTLKFGYIINLAITFAFLLVALIIQLRALKFHAVRYWLVMVGTNTVGTKISDLKDRTLGLGCTRGFLIFLSCLLLTIVLWYKNKGEIEVYPVTQRKVESFYRIAILFSNSLGTAFGDNLTDVAGLSYLTGAAVTAGVIIIVLLLHYYTKAKSDIALRDRLHIYQAFRSDLWRPADKAINKRWS